MSWIQGWWNQNFRERYWPGPWLCARSEKLTQVFYDISSKLYSQAQGANAGSANAEDNDNVVHDADYKVEDDQK